MIRFVQGCAAVELLQVGDTRGEVLVLDFKGSVSWSAMMGLAAMSWPYIEEARQIITRLTDARLVFDEMPQSCGPGALDDDEKKIVLVGGADQMPMLRRYGALMASLGYLRPVYHDDCMPELIEWLSACSRRVLPVTDGRAISGFSGWLQSTPHRPLLY